MKGLTLGIGPMRFDVEAVADLQTDDGTGIDGHIKLGTGILEIEANLPREGQQVTLVHELLHAVLFQAGQREFHENEGLLDALAYGLVAATVNPGEITGHGPSILQSLFDVMDGGDG